MPGEIAQRSVLEIAAELAGPERVAEAERMLAEEFEAAARRVIARIVSASAPAIKDATQLYFACCAYALHRNGYWPTSGQQVVWMRITHEHFRAVARAAA